MRKLAVLFLHLAFCVSSIAQESHYNQSVRFYREGKLDRAKSAIDLEIKEAKKSHQKERMALAYVHKGLVVWDTDGIAQAFKVVDTAINLTKKLPYKSTSRVAAFTILGQLYVQQMEFKKAAAQFKLAQEAIDEEKPLNKYRIALHNQIALMHLMTENYLQARKYAEQGYQLNLQLEGKDGPAMPGLVQTLFFIANYSDQYQKALHYGEELERLVNIHYLPGHRIFGVLHNSLAIIHEALHHYEKALYHRQLAVDIQFKQYQKTKNPFSLGAAYQNLGVLYGYINENQLASNYLKKGSDLLTQTYGKDGAAMVNILVDLAVSKQKLGDFDQAAKIFERAYQLQQFHDAENWAGMAYVESFFGDLRMDQKQVDEAIKLYQSSLLHYEKAGVEYGKTALLTKEALAKALVAKGKFSEAMKLQLAVLNNFRSIYPKGNDAIARLLEGLSETSLAAGNDEQALNYSNQVFGELLHLKSFNGNYGNWLEKLPFSYYSSSYVKHHLMILYSLYLKTKQTSYLETILSITDQYSDFIANKLYFFRTQASLVQLSALNKSIYNIAIEACWKLSTIKKNKDFLLKAFMYSERGKTLTLTLAANNLLVETVQTQGNAKREIQRDREFRSDLSALNLAYIQATEKDSLLNLLSKKMEQYRIFQDSLKKTGHALMEAKHRISIPSLAEIRTGLLAGGQTLIEFAVTEQSIFTFILQKNGFYVLRNEKEVLSTINKLKDLHQISPGIFNQTSFKLYQTLIKPIAQHFTSRKLLIIPDEQFYYLNFELLVTKGRESDYAKMNYLIKDYDISYLLSAGTAMQFKKANRMTNNDKALLFAPVFTDEMKSSYAATGKGSGEDLSTYKYLYRQPFALQAVQKIGKYVASDFYVEQKADESAFKKAAPNYRFLHLGTHAEVNNQSPLQSKLFFAKMLPADSTYQDDGYLHAYEIYAMQLKAELAVLTACETGNGSYQHGEGIMSLANSFMHAGCSSVIMSLWKIDDKTSSSIITEFYKLLSEGKSKSEALRLAKLDYLKKANSDMSNPYFWAGLALIGDDTPVYPDKTHWIWYVLGVFVLLASGIYFFKHLPRVDFSSSNKA